MTEEQTVSEGQAAAEEPGTSRESRVRVFTLRAICIGAVIPLLIGLMGGDHAQLLRSQLPVTFILVALLLGLVINPLLGRRRLSRPEMVVVATMTLSIGGIMMGLHVILSSVVGVPDSFARYVRFSELQEPVSEERREQVQHRLLEDARLMLAKKDRNGDGALTAADMSDAERFDRLDENGDGAVQAEEWLAAELRRYPELDPEDRLAVAPPYYATVYEPGRVDAADPEFRHVVEGYKDGLSDGEFDLRVAHRMWVTWRDGDGQRHRAEALAGEARRQALRERRAFLDLDDPDFGNLLLGLRPGNEVTMPDGETVEILAIDPPETPWYAWLGPLLLWAPMLAAFLLMMIGVAGLVRRQWIHYERLTFPLGEIMHQLIGRGEHGASRFAPLFRNKAFWAGFAFAAIAGIWKGLYAYDLITVDFKTQIDFQSLLEGPPWDRLPHHYIMRSFRISLPLIAIAYFMPRDMSFSLWSIYLGANVICMLLAVAGLAQVNARDLSQMSAGGFITMAALIVYIGRHWYWRCLKAAFGFGGPEMRTASAYVWVLFGGVGLACAVLMGMDVPLHWALLMCLCLLGSILVFARLVAEAGYPFPSFPSNVQAQYIFFTLTGFSLPVVSLVPLAIVGVVAQRAIDPAIINAAYLGDREQVPKHRQFGLIAITGIVVAVLGAVSMLIYSYNYGNFNTRQIWNVTWHGVDVVSRGFKVASNPNSSTNQDTAAIGDYAIGAVIVLVLGIARFRFARWPLHPLAFLVVTSWMGMTMYFSFFLGWLTKGLVLRYGGTGIYQKLKAPMLGILAGAGLVVAGFAVLALIGEHYNMDWPYVGL